MSRFIHYYILLALLQLTSLPASAQNAVGDYDSLSHLTSQQLMDSGRAYFEQRQAGKALACFTVVGERYKERNSTDELQLSIRALNNSGCVYKFFYFDYLHAYDCFTRAYELCRQAEYDEFLPVVMVNLADLLNDYGLNYDSQPVAQRARDIFEACMKRARESHNWELMLTAFFNLSNQNYTLPLDDYRVILSEEIPDTTPDLHYLRLQWQGLHHLQQGRTAEARQCFMQQLPVVSARWEPERDTLASYMSIAHTYRCDSNYTSEADYLERACQLALDRDIGDQATVLLSLLADCYARQGLADRSRDYRIRYLEKREEIHANRMMSIDELTYIDDLRREEQRAQQLLERHQWQQWLLLAVGAAVLVLIGAALLLWTKNRQLHRRNRSLYDKNRLLLQAEQEAALLRRDCDTAEKYTHSNLSDPQRQSLLFRVQEVLGQPDIVCQQDFTLTKLAKLVDSNTTYVSQAINEHYGTAFSNVLAAQRIKEACRRMSDETDRYAHVTIEAIATSVGFKSRTTFITAFKRETGLTPSEYLRAAQA